MPNILSLFFWHCSFAFLFILEKQWSKTCPSTILVLSQEHAIWNAVVVWEEESYITGFDLKRKTAQFQSDVIRKLDYIDKFNHVKNQDEISKEWCLNLHFLPKSGICMEPLVLFWPLQLGLSLLMVENSLVYSGLFKVINDGGCCCWYSPPLNALIPPLLRFVIFLLNSSSLFLAL